MEEGKEQNWCCEFWRLLAIVTETNQIGYVYIVPWLEFPFPVENINQDNTVRDSQCAKFIMFKSRFVFFFFPQKYSVNYVYHARVAEKIVSPSLDTQVSSFTEVPPPKNPLKNYWDSQVPNEDTIERVCNFFPPNCYKP